MVKRGSYSVLDIEQKIQGFEQQTVALEAKRSEREQEVQRLEKELEVLTEDVELLDKVEKTLQAVSSKVLGASTKTIDRLVSTGLKSIFYDQNLEFKTCIDKYRGKTSIKFELFEDGHTHSLMDSFGGGVLTVIGVLLRVTTIIVLGKRKILFLDESLNHLSEQYVPAASELLKKICAQLDFIVVMVTHEPLFAQHADKHYEAKKLNGATVFEEQTSPSTIATT